MEGASQIYRILEVYILQMSFVDSTNAAVVVENGGIPLIIQCLSSPVENTVRTCEPFLGCSKNVFKFHSISSLQSAIEYSYCSA